MHIKRIHEMIEKLSEYCQNDICKGYDQLDVAVVGEAVDMLKDLCEAEYHARIAKAMEEAEKEDEEEAKHILKTLKDEYKDEYKHYRDEYGEDADRRFYDNYRYKTSGRFAPKGRGSYMPRRGYDEMPYMMMPQVHNPMEWDRDMDRMDGRMYYSDGGQSSGGNSGGQSGQSRGGSSSGGMSGNMGGNTRGYEEGYSDGNRRGYEEGYERGRSEGNRNNSSRYDNARRNYTETKQMHKGNSQEDNTENMRSLEKLLNIIGEDVKEYMPTMSASEKSLAKQKIENMAKSIQ